MKRYLFFVSKLYELSILRPLQTAIRARGDTAAWFFDSRSTDNLRADERLLETVTGVKTFAPDVVFASGNVVPDFFPGVKVELFHGFNVNKRDPERGHFRIRGFFDLYCTQGPDTTGRFQELARRHGHFRVAETGWPKMDPLFTPHPAPYPVPPGKPVVLYASTFTHALTSAPHLLETIDRLSRTSRWHWLVTFHPKMDREWVERYRGIQHEHLEFVETDDIIPPLKAADVMVSDTSSVASEFLLQRRPVVTFRNRRPGPHLIDVTEPEALEPAIGHALTRPADLMATIAAYGDRIHPYRDGRSSERVLAAVDDFVANGRKGLKRKPLNLTRKFKVRKRLRYYRLT